MQRLILFDIDGTLTDNPIGHIEAHAVAYQKVFGLLGSIYMIDYQGKTDRRITREVLTKLGVSNYEIDTKMQAHFQAMCDYFSAVKPYLSPKVLPNAIEVLNMLSTDENNILGLVTGNLEHIAHEKLDAVGINNFFELGGFGNESDDRVDLVRNAIRKAVDEHAFVETKNVYIIGDTPQDILAGLAANVKTIGVTTGKYSSKDLKDCGADVVLTNLEQIEELKKALDM